jgi:putative ABC transport system permease protein
MLSFFALGAGAKKALLGFGTSAYLIALMPTINAMLMIGIVKLPGMMTGQIIGGGNVTQSIYYQIVIMFMILFSSALSMFVFRVFHSKLIFEENAFFRED